MANKQADAGTKRLTPTVQQVYAWLDEGFDFTRHLNRHDLIEDLETAARVLRRWHYDPTAGG